MGVFIPTRGAQAPSVLQPIGAIDMSKNLDRKKEAKKKPAKSLKEKRALKEQKKSGR